MYQVTFKGRTVTAESKAQAIELAIPMVGKSFIRAEIHHEGRLVELVGNKLRANEIPAEILLRGLPREQWSLGWEAIMDATEKDIEFKTQGAIFAYIKTYIYRKEFNNDYYQRRRKNEEGVVENTYIMKSLPVTAAMEKYGIAELNADGESNYQDMIGGAFFNGTINDDLTDNTQEMEIHAELVRLDIPEYFIERIMDGDRIPYYKLSKEEKGYIDKLRKEFAHLLK